MCSDSEVAARILVRRGALSKAEPGQFLRYHRALNRRRGGKLGRRDFGRYKIAEELGRGAMGVVYRATDPLLGRSVAIKAINEAYIENLGISAGEYYERFRREAEVAGGLN